MPSFDTFCYLWCLSLSLISLRRLQGRALSLYSQDSRLIQSVHRDGLVLEATVLEPGAAVMLRPAADGEVRQKWVAGSDG